MRVRGRNRERGVVPEQVVERFTGSPKTEEGSRGGVNRRLERHLGVIASRVDEHGARS